MNVDLTTNCKLHSVLHDIHNVSNNIAPPSDFENGRQGTTFCCMKIACGFFHQSFALNTKAL